MNDTIPITVRVPTRDVERLDAIAAQLVRPRSYLVRQALIEFINRREQVDYR